MFWFIDDSGLLIVAVSISEDDDADDWFELNKDELDEHTLCVSELVVVRTPFESAKTRDRLFLNQF